MQAPFDGRFKSLAEDHPELLLRLLGVLGPGAKPKIVDIPRELQLDPVRVDQCCRIVDESGERLVHLEAITRWSAQRTSVLTLYRFLLRRKYKLPVASYAVLLAERYAPSKLPDRVVYEEDDGFRIEAPYQVVRLWKLDSSMAFERGCEALLPWVPLLKGGEAELERAAVAIEGLAAHPGTAPYPMLVMVNNLATLATLRYDKDVIRHFVERLGTKMTLSTDLFVDSWLYKDGVAAGEAKGIAAGEAKGKAEGKRGSVRSVLRKRFPEIGELPEIEQIASCDAIDQLLLAVIDARTPDEIHSAVRAALQLKTT